MLGGLRVVAVEPGERTVALNDDQRLRLLRLRETHRLLRLCGPRAQLRRAGDFLHDPDAAHGHEVPLDAEALRAVDGQILESDFRDRIRPLGRSDRQVLRGGNRQVARLDLLGAHGCEPLRFGEAEGRLVRADRARQCERGQQGGAERKRSGAVSQPRTGEQAPPAKAAQRPREQESRSVHEPHRIRLDVESVSPRHETRYRTMRLRIGRRWESPAVSRCRQGELKAQARRAQVGE